MLPESLLSRETVHRYKCVFRERYILRQNSVLSLKDQFLSPVFSLDVGRTSREKGNPFAGQRPSTTYFVKGKHWFNRRPTDALSRSLWRGYYSIRISTWFPPRFLPLAMGTNPSRWWNPFWTKDVHWIAFKISSFKIRAWAKVYKRDFSN